MAKSKPRPRKDRTYINNRTGKLTTREEWEKNHKPTCQFYPCDNWPEIHWHL